MLATHRARHENTKTRSTTITPGLRRALIASWLLIAAASASSTAQSKRAMTLDDAIDLVQVSAPRISPDGSRVLYTVSELGKWKDNKRVTSIWIANADGTGARKFLGHERDRNVAWSPDGQSIAFLGSRDASSNGDG